ncbi:MAG: IS3 family transposase [Sulfurospirillaceae bacterium]|nr:IS3 family transposase [Sulfurospirillaceae bacterium]MDD3463733.1 IS3 family transposase [Sulfurospirillaceae bacterium]
MISIKYLHVGLLKRFNQAGYISNFTTIEELKNGINDYMHKYNFKRFHSSIGYQKPMNVYLDYVKSVA